MAMQRLALPPEAAGRVKRPVFRVIRASFRPLPSPRMMFFAGTFTSSNLMTPFWMARMPKNRQRCSTLKPGDLVSTTKAVICLRSFPRTSTSGVRAITTM
jgi:hypothetical protein